MLKKINVLAIFLSLMLMTIVSGAEKTGYLSVTVEAGVQIYVDTSYAGQYSFTDMELPVGKHTVHVYNAQSRDWSDRGFSKTIEITENQPVKLDFTQTDQIKLLSLPVGVKVFAGNVLIGNTPITFNRNLVGANAIKLEKKGYSDLSFNLVADQKEYHFNLAPLQDDNPLKVATSLDSQNGLKWYREGLIVTSLISSWTAFYYKRQADEAYSKYLVISDSQRRNDLWNQTRQYDTFAEVAIGVSVATLGTYFILLLMN
jgi:hypothetical protein